MKFRRIIEIDGIDYSEQDIFKLQFEQIKMLVSFIDNEHDLLRVKQWRKDCMFTESYINNLILNI